MKLSIASESPAPSSPASTRTMGTNGRLVSTPPSSLPPSPEEDEVNEDKDAPIPDQELEERMVALSGLLERVAAYSALLKQQMERVKTRRRATAPGDVSASTSVTKAKTKSVSDQTRKRSLVDATEDENSGSAKRAKVDDDDGAQAQCSDEDGEGKDGHAFVQPVLVSGATLKDYQLEGVAWMAGLYNNGISGILADEMGLGKTLQTIAFHAWMRQRTPAPFLVVCPLSVLNNWVEEFHRFAPEIPVCMYHGTPEERAQMRRTQMVFSDEDMIWQNDKNGYHNVATPSPARARPGKKTTRGKAPSARGKASTKTKQARSASGPGSSANTPLPPHQKTNFPVVITTYEMIIKDRAHLLNYHWGFIIVDEGHRLKNLDCKLMREIKQLRSESRMVLTGTPLHNNLAELWALLNFVLPNIFTDLAAFQEWFDLPTLQSTLSASRSSKLINSLHSILRPFLLRRLKVDVEADLPPKKEYVLYAPLSERQREVYDAVVSGGLRELLVKQAGQRALKGGSPTKKDKNGSTVLSDDGSGGESETEVPLKANTGQRASRRTGLRDGKRRDYARDDEDDEEYFRRMERGELELEEQRPKKPQQTVEELGREWQYKSTLKKVNNMKLQNAVMQLRKVCSHPFLFDWPLDPETQQPVLSAELVGASGKMMILDRLLDELFRRKHKVLLFSQFTTMLDIIEDWALEFKGWSICRIDGSTSMADRREEVSRFQNSGDAPDAPRLFLLSTRAGGLGLNLVAADTVVFYDQDWNPQMDLQAQDRAHRIGQTKPVLIFRLATAHTIETKIMQRAAEKRKLEALVIAKGKFKSPTLRSKPETMAEMAAALLRLEGEQIEVVSSTAAGQASVISDEDLDVLLDRRPEVFTNRGKGWTSSSDTKDLQRAGEPSRGERVRRSGKAAFAVYEAPVDEGADMLAGMLGEGVEDEEQ